MTDTLNLPLSWNMQLELQKWIFFGKNHEYEINCLLDLMLKSPEPDEQIKSKQVTILISIFIPGNDTFFSIIISGPPPGDPSRVHQHPLCWYIKNPRAVKYNIQVVCPIEEDTTQWSELFSERAFLFQSTWFFLPFFALTA